MPDQDAALTEIRDVFLKALPGISVRCEASVAMRGCWGPFEDTEGVSSHFDGAAGRLAGVKKIKRIRPSHFWCSAKPRALSPSSWSDSVRAGL